MLTCVNGRLVPSEQAVVSVFDRGFLYGDGLFETLRVYGGEPVRWEEHWRRFERGAAFLKITPPAPELVRQLATELVRQNQLPDCVLRYQLTRGTGPRGYSPQGAGTPTLIITTHPAPATDPNQPPRWRLVTTSFCIRPDDPLGRHKTCNKLPHVLARAEAEAHGADEGLLLTPAGEVAEATSGNVFWIQEGTVCTAPERLGILPGITRATVLNLCSTLEIPTQEISVIPEELQTAEGMFMTLSTWGVVEVSQLDDHMLPQSALVSDLRTAYEALAGRNLLA